MDRQTEKRQYNSKCDLGASVGCEAVSKTFNTPRLKSHLLLYYLLVTLIINKFPTDYSNNDYYTLAKNIEENINLYKQLFGSEIER